MTRINLLPREIAEKRKFERRIGFTLVAGLIVYAVLLVIYAGLAWTVSQRNVELQSNLDLAASLSAQAEAFRIFEDREADLDRRADIAEVALAGRVDWARISNELSLVLPPDVWLSELRASEQEGLLIRGMAVDLAADVPDAGHKAVARTLVRLGNLELLQNVWLTTSGKAMFAVGEEERPVIEFEVTTGVLRPPGPPQATTGVPAPPAPPAQ